MTDHEEIERLRKEYEEAREEEKDAASRASAAAEELHSLGVEIEE